MDNADLIAALDLVVNTGHATTDEHGNPHWAISKRQRDVARRALEAATQAEFDWLRNATTKGTAKLKIVAGDHPTDIIAIKATCSECDHTTILSHDDWSAIVCQGCKAELTQAGAQ